jgi:predicted ester cyclase
MGIPATGREVSVSGINIERVRGGRITDVSHCEDLVGLMQQLGAVPASGPSVT